MMLFALLLLAQDPSLDDLLEDLRSDSLERREAAADTLTRIVDRDVVGIRKAFHDEEDAEAKARLGAVLRTSKAYRQLLVKEFVSGKDAVREQAGRELLGLKDELVELLAEHLDAERTRDFLREAIPDRLQNGCIVRFRADKARYQEAEPVIVSLEVWNLGAKPVRIYAPITYDVVVGGHGLSEWTYRTAFRRDHMQLEPGGVLRERARVEIRAGAGVHRVEAGRMGGPVRAAVRITTVPTEDPALRTRKLERLIGDIAASIDRSKNPRPDYRAVRDILEMGEDIVEPLQAYRTHEVPLVRAHVLRLLSRLAAEKSRPLLEEALSDGIAEVRVAALDSISRIGADASKKKVFAMVADPDVSVRCAALRIAESDPGEEATRLLLGRLEDDDGPVRLTAAAILAHRGRSEGVLILIDLGLSSESEFSQIQAIRALEKLTGLSFGSVMDPMLLSNTSQIEKVQEENRKVRKKWLEWWEKEGRKKYGK